MMREFVRKGLIVPEEPLHLLSREQLEQLALAQNSLSKILFEVQQLGRDANGQIIIFRDTVREALRRACPLYPFC